MKNNRNTLVGLNDFLFGQLERLDDPDMSVDQLEFETKRTKAMISTAHAIISNANTALEAEKLKLRQQEWIGETSVPELIGIKES